MGCRWRRSLSCLRPHAKCPLQMPQTMMGRREPQHHLHLHLHAWPTQVLVCQALNLQWNELCNPMISCQLKSTAQNVKCSFFFFSKNTSWTDKGKAGVAAMIHTFRWRNKQLHKKIHKNQFNTDRKQHKQVTCIYFSCHGNESRVYSQTCISSTYTQVEHNLWSYAHEWVVVVYNILQKYWSEPFCLCFLFKV